MLERLVAAGTEGGGAPRPRVVRLGHPARLSPAVLKHSLEAGLATADGADVVADAKAELKSLLRQAAYKSGRKSSGGPAQMAAAQRQARSEAKVVRAEVRRREHGLTRSLLDSADVVFATTVGAASHLLDVGTGAKAFDIVVIDEAAQGCREGWGLLSLIICAV